MLVLTMVGVILWLLAYPIPLPLVAGHAHVNQNATQGMELCACVRILTPHNSNRYYYMYTALDPCIAASNGGCDRNANCVMTGPGLVSE